MSGIYNRAKKQWLAGELDLDGHTIKAMLVDDAYVYNPDHNFVSNVSGDEVSGTGYTGGFAGSGRKTLGSPVVAQDDSANRGYFDAADVTWTGINVGLVGAIILYRSVSTDADSPLIAHIDTGATFPITTNGGDLVVQWSTSPLGILQLTG